MGIKTQQTEQRKKGIEMGRWQVSAKIREDNFKNKKQKTKIKIKRGTQQKLQNRKGTRENK